MKALLLLLAAAVASGLIVFGLGWRMVAEGGCPAGGSPLGSARCVDGGQP